MTQNKKTVIGLGRAGMRIALELQELDWNAFVIDSDAPNSSNSRNIGTRSSPEGWEEDIPDISKITRKIRKGTDILFVVSSCGKISSASAVILEQLKKCNMSVLLIRPPQEESLSLEAKLLDRMTFHIFQEWARSGVLERLYIVSNGEIEKLLGGVPVLGYFDKLNEVIVTSVNIITTLNELEPVVGSSKNSLPIGTRISTFGIKENVEENTDRMLFKLDNPTDIVYYYALREERLKDDKNLLQNIRQQVKQRSNKTGARVSFKVYSTNHENDYVYVLYHTSITQTEEMAQENG